MTKHKSAADDGILYKGETVSHAGNFVAMVMMMKAAKKAAEQEKVPQCEEDIAGI